MNVLVDTSVWSLALRRKKVPDKIVVKELHELIKEFRVQIIGSIRQEILSGIRSKKYFDHVKDHLRSFPDLEVTTLDYERAAEFFNIARTKGIQGSNTDFLIGAVAERCKLAIFTTDDDFIHFQKHLPVKLHIPRKT